MNPIEHPELLGLTEDFGTLRDLLRVGFVTPTTSTNKYIISEREL